MFRGLATCLEWGGGRGRLQGRGQDFIETVLIMAQNPVTPKISSFLQVSPRCFNNNRNPKMQTKKAPRRQVSYPHPLASLAGESIGKNLMVATNKLFFNSLGGKRTAGNMIPFP